MKITLCTLVLNEMQWLPYLYKQHKDFPNLLNWIFVESADNVYAQSNPNLVTSEGLSVDGTTEYLEELTRTDDRVIHIKHGIAKHDNIAQNKCQCRNRYLEKIDELPNKPDNILVLDADEFWTKQAQDQLVVWLSINKNIQSYSFNHREIWHPIHNQIFNIPPFSQEVKGGFWNILYCRGWKYLEGMRYISNHNTPTNPHTKRLMTDRGFRDHRKHNAFYRNNPTKIECPEFIHMGFASKANMRLAKNRYYQDRGEGRTDHRKWYVDSRDMFDKWTPETELPRGARVVPYTGQIPECFLDDEGNVVI